MQKPAGPYGNSREIETPTLALRLFQRAAIVSLCSIAGYAAACHGAGVEPFAAAGHAAAEQRVELTSQRISGANISPEVRAIAVDSNWARQLLDKVKQAVEGLTPNSEYLSVEEFHGELAAEYFALGGTVD